jgi:hypothetical protein
VQCGNDICCSSDQFCCGTQPGGYCCDNGSICVKGQLEIWLYSYCCSAGSDPAGGQTDVGGRQLVAYCRQADQTCCGPFGPCNRGQYCADATFCICCPAGQSFCGGNCCDGTCLTYNKGTSAENRVCCPKPTVGPICCAPNNCQTSASGGQVCCAHPPLCGELCCEPPATCHNSQCGFNPCGNTFCGFAHCCDGVCCGFNHTCVDGLCTNATCPSGQVPCPVTPGQCCPPNFQCCANNTCCDPSTTECCGGRGCVPIGSCIQ